MDAQAPLRVLLLAGPTASGKTAAAIAVAERFGAIVLSADAMQVYRGMDIGTAKATAEERARVPHEGIDLVDPHERFDAAEFVKLADRLVAANRRVILAGGTSFYLRSFVRGLVATPPVDPELRERLEALEEPHAVLSRVDPALAARLHPNDHVRIIRGLEVYHLSGSTLSSMHAEHAEAPDRVEAVGLWLDRDDLDHRIDARVEAMIAAGYVEEVRRLLEQGVSRNEKPMQSLGYRHLCAHLLDGLALDESIRRTQRDTRRFARKQRNWMRALGYDRVTERASEQALRAAEHLWGRRA